MEKSLALCHYILGLIDASPEGLDEKKTALIKNRLHDIFEHEIDPSFGFSKTESDQAQKVHDGLEDIVSDFIHKNPQIRL